MLSFTAILGRNGLQYMEADKTGDSQLNKKELRHQKICNLLSAHDHLSVPQLCAELKRSEATIRNDLRELESNGMVKRVYGGVMSTGNTLHEVPLPSREILHQHEKEKIAKYVVDNILKPHQTIILDAGTTTTALASMIAKMQIPLTVATNSIPCVSILAENPEIKIYVAGGIYDPKVGSCHDLQTINSLNMLYTDIYFLCPTGISVDTGFTVPDQGGADVKRAMMKRASKTIALADQSKFDKTGLHIICSLHDLDYVVTDNKLANDMTEKFENAGLVIKSASQD